MGKEEVRGWAWVRGHGAGGGGNGDEGGNGGREIAWESACQSRCMTLVFMHAFMILRIMPARKPR